MPQKSIKILTTKDLINKSNKIIKSNDAVNHLNDVVEYFEHCTKQKQQSPAVMECLLKLEEIFITLIENGRMTSNTPQTKEKTIDDKNIEIIQHLYKTTKQLISKCFNNKTIEITYQALKTSMKFLALQTNVQSFKNGLTSIYTKLLSSKYARKHLFIYFKQHFGHYIDVVNYSWQLLPNIMQKGSATTELYIQNYFDLLSAIPISVKSLQSSDSELLCKNLQTDKTHAIDYDELKKCVNKVWKHTRDWTLSTSTHKQILLILIDIIMPNLKNQIIVTDFLIDSLDAGGQISVLALQGVFMLCQQSNIAYPNIYEKLYSLFQSDIFHAKYKARLFYLADLFLSSTHLSKNLIAAFAKRLSRLSLIAPPQDIIIIVYFIENLLIRHPEVKENMMKIAAAMLQQQQQQQNEQDLIATDPFVMNESDPLLSNALGSTLWEIHCHKRHALPTIDHLSSDLIYYRLPTVEWDLSQYLDVTDKDIFDQEIAFKSSKCGLNFERITDVSKDNHWLHWNL